MWTSHLSSIRSGSWLTPARLRAYPLIMLALSLAAAVWLALSESVAQGRREAKRMRYLDLVADKT